MGNNKFNRIWLRSSLVWSLILVVSCSDKQESVTQIQTCINHYQAESYIVAYKECLIAAQQGSRQAKWLIAHIYRYDLMGKGDAPEKAFEWYLKAAEQGHVAAMREVGQSYLYENGVELDYQQAHRWLMKSASKQDVEAEFSVGLMFFEGLGRAKDIGSAISWFKKSANKQHNMSINNLAWIFSTSENTAFFRPKKAKFWIKRLDQSSLNVAMFLDTKAAVMAASELFEQAVELQNQAIAKLPVDTSEEELLEFQKHLDSYIQGKAWHE